MVAGVAELVDARDSKSRDFGHVGSSPTSGTNLYEYELPLKLHRGNYTHFS